MDKIMAFITALSMLFSSLGIPVSSLNSPDKATVPVVHVVGTGAGIVRDNPDGTTETLFPYQLPENFIDEAANELLPVFMDAFLTQEWGEFCDVLLETLIPIFSSPALDKNGEVTDGSRVNWGWSIDSLRSQLRGDGTYSASGFQFHYDWRLDPLVTAETLHRFIEDVMYVTGSDEVVLYGRCLGSNIVAAYMYRYDGEYVKEVIHYASAVYGATQCSKAFTGELRLHADGISRFAYEVENLNVAIDQVYLELIYAIVTLLNETYGLDIIEWAVNNVLKDIYLDIFPEFMRATYGTYPSYWSMVTLDDYKMAKETVFHGVDTSEYAGLIEKVENYRNNVQIKFGQRTLQQRERGIEFSNIVKYGVQSIPVTENSDELSDGFCTVRESSFGATCVKVEEAFSQDYINKAKANGTFKYISPDNQIDASTCLSPDTTWYIKNIFHTNFPETVNGLVSDIVNNEGFTVNSNPEYPQYLLFDKENGELVPLPEGDTTDVDKWHSITLLEALKIIFEFIKNLINAA